MTDNRTEAEVLARLFWDHPGNTQESMIAVAAKVRELDALGHAAETERAYIRGWRDRDAGSAWSPKPPQPPKPKTAGEAARETFSRGTITTEEAWENAAQAAHEFLSRPKVTAGELLHRATYPGGSWAAVRHFDRNDYEDRAQAFLTLAREHGLLEAGE